MAEALNLLIDQGSSYSINLEVKDANNSLVNLTGYSGTGHIRKQYTSNSATAFTVSVYSNGTLTAYLSANQTSSLVSDRYVYDIELTNTVLEVTRILEGIVTVTPQVTRFDNGDQVLTSNGITVYLAGGGNFTNGQSISVNNFTLTGSFTASSSNGSAGQVLTSNATSVYWSTLTTGTVTQVATGIGLAGGPITNTGTISVLANTGIVANTAGLFVNTAFIGTLTANNTSFVGNVSAASVVSNAQLTANVSALQSQITSNADTTYTNAVAYVDSRPFVNTSQLSSNLTNYVTTTNLTNNLALYATIANPTFTGDVTTGNVIINTTGGIRANGSFGTNGQVLTSNGTTVYWSTGASFTNGQSISVNNFTLTGTFTANSSNGSNGQILISNGTGAYWGPAPLAETFEYYSKNLKSVNNTIVYANTGFASNIVYSDGTVKSLFYDINNFVIRVNITASGFAGNKYISYSNNAVSAITYGT